MKIRRFISVILILLLVLPVLPPGTTAQGSTVPTDWAVAEMNDANTAGLLTHSAARDFHRVLTRVEFCELVVEMVERTLGSELPLPEENPFTDSNSVHVQKANEYGIIYGVGGGRFDPDSGVERQQLCTMIVRAIKNLERDMSTSYLNPATALPFNDVANIASYAADSIRIAYASGIMYGDNANNFNPASGITSQECVAVIIRSFNMMQEKYSEGKSEERVLNMAYERLRIGFAYGDTENGVTRNVLLPETGIGGVEITWKSSNVNTISAAGIVKTGATPETVTLTATLRLGSASLTKEFILVTSPYTGERLLVENAYNALEVIYIKSGDGPESVTGRVCLPDNILGLPVEWTSSNPNVISSNGQVNLPQGNDVRSVTVTATITSGSSSRAKSFDLKVNNPQYTNHSVTLFGVGLGITQAQAAQVLGAPKKSFRVSTTETWNVYHDNYKNFVAAGFSGNVCVAVYSSAADAANQLKDAAKTVLTVAQANGYSNIGVTSYTDKGNSDREYAIMMYTQGSVIGTSRTLYADGQEQLLLELVNAYRSRNSRSVLEWNTRLGSSARNHSSDMGSYNYLSVTSRNGNSFADRAVVSGYEAKLVSGGNVLGGANDVVEFLDNMINTTEMRTDLLDQNATVFGAGYAGGYGGRYKTYLTYVFGTLNAIKSVTTSPATVNLTAGGSISVNIVLNPANANETFRWSSSNVNILKLTGTEGTKSIKAEGVRAGSANIIITGASSGNTYSIPVSVGTAYASALTLKYGTTATAVTSNSTVFMGSGDVMQVTAATTPASGPLVSWSSNNTNVVTVSSTGALTARGAGTATITATTQKSATENITIAFTVYVAELTFKENGSIIASNTAIKLSADTAPSRTIEAEASPLVGVTYDYDFALASGSSAIVAGIAKSANTCTLTAQNPGTITVNVTVKRTGSIGTIVRSLTVTVTSTAYATNLTLDPDTALTLEMGQSKKILAVTTPAAVTYNNIVWDSSNKTVATVDNAGNVVARSVGTAVISATISSSTGLISKVITVTVTAKSVALNSLTISGADSVTAGESKPYTVNYSPTNTTYKSVTWDISDPTAASMTISGETATLVFNAGITTDTVIIVTVRSNTDPSRFAVKTITIKPKT